MAESGNEAETFRALLLSLPAHSSTIRMRVWRALKNTGCAVLRDGVYILPVGAPRTALLEEVESAIASAGGFAMTAELVVNGKARLARVHRMFARNAEYAALVDRIERAKRTLRRLDKRKAQTAVQRLRRSFEELAAMDFYPGEARLQSGGALSSLEVEARELFAEGEPRALKARVPSLDPKRYRRRTWATRKAPWIDRLACCWLIRRFIDRQAKFLWIDGPRGRPRHAIGFDFDGAQFTHVGHRVTYEVLLAAFGLARDHALASIGAVVHFLDVGGIEVADAKGLETLLAGIAQKARSDDGRAREAAKIFDLLYDAYSRRREELPDSIAVI